MERAITLQASSFIFSRQVNEFFRRTTYLTRDMIPLVFRGNGDTSVNTLRLKSANWEMIQVLRVIIK